MSDKARVISNDKIPTEAPEIVNEAEDIKKPSRTQAASKRAPKKPQVRTASVDNTTFICR